MNPHSKPKGLSELPTPVWRGKEGLRAGGSPSPELPKSGGTLQKQLGKKKDASNTCQVSWLATPTIVVMGVHIDLIRIRNHLLSVLVR